jgi:hypothetical protein
MFSHQTSKRMLKLRMHRPRRLALVHINIFSFAVVQITRSKERFLNAFNGHGSDLYYYYFYRIFIILISLVRACYIYIERERENRRSGKGWIRV